MAWGVVVMTAVGFLVGFRLHGGTGCRAGRLGLDHLYGFAFVWVFITLGLMAGSPQAAQGLSFLVFPLELRLERLRPGVDHAGLDAGIRQPPADDAHVQYGAHPHRGTAAQHLLGHSLSYYLVPSLLWTGGIIVVFAPLAVWNLRRS